MLAADLGGDTLGTGVPTYSTDLSAYVQSVSTQRGRQTEFEPINTGTAKIQLENRTGDFDPTNSGGAFSANLLPLVPTQLAYPNPITGGTAIPIFTGYVEDWDFVRQGPRGSQATAGLVDGMELLANAPVNPQTGGRLFASYYAAQHVDDRIRAALLDAGWPAALTQIATGNVNVQAANYEAEQMIQEVIHDAVDAEFPGVAAFFTTAAGLAYFSGRGIRFAPDLYGFNPLNGSGHDWTHWDTTNARPGWRVGDADSIALDPTLLPIYDMTWNWGKDQLYNDVVVTPEGASNTDINTNHQIDAASITRYGRRGLTISGLKVLDGNAPGGGSQSGLACTLDYANYYKDNYAVPRSRITTIEFHGQMDDGSTTPGGVSGALWDFILGVEINHLVEVFTLHPGGGGIQPSVGNELTNAVGQYYVEGISHEITNLNETIPNWKMTLALSPRARFATYP